MAPRIRSSHMNQKRYWPGVPNRYRTRSSARLMRPKSIATVVVDFIGMPVRLSIPALALVTNASVRSGTISETAPTNVVLPTPKPPATTILAEVGLAVRVSTCAVESNTPETTENPFDQLATFIVAGVVFQCGRNANVPRFDEICHEHTRHPDGYTQSSRNFSHGRRFSAQLHDGRFDVGQFELPLEGDRMRCDEGLQRELDLGPGTARGQRIRADEAGLGAPHTMIFYVHPTIRNPS